MVGILVMDKDVKVVFFVRADATATAPFQVIEVPQS